MKKGLTIKAWEGQTFLGVPYTHYKYRKQFGKNHLRYVCWCGENRLFLDYKLKSNLYLMSLSMIKF